MNSPRRFLSLVGLGLAAAGFGSIQERLPPGPQNVVNVGLKLVQVFVTDKAGQPVHDLRAEDFEVFDNEKPQPIIAFEVHSARRPAAPAAPGPPEPKAGRKFIFLFDYFMNDPAGIERSKAVALDFIAGRLRPDDEVAVLSYSHLAGAVVLLDLTKDHTQAAKIVREMKNVTRLKSADDTYSMNVIDSNAETRDEKDSDNEIIIRESSLYCNDLAALAKSLQAIDGFKNILFFSRGLSSDIFTGGEIDDPNNMYGLVVFELYQDMLNKLAQAGSPVFTVNTLGARGSSKKEDRRTLGVDALVGLAKATGGTYFPTADFVAPLSEKIDAATSQYYVLGYRVDISWDGSFHKLEVRVRRPGCEVRTPRGYFQPKKYEAYTAAEKNEQLLDLEEGKSSPFLIPYEIPLLVLPLDPPQDRRDADCLILSDFARPELRELAGARSEIALVVVDENRKTVLSRRAEFSFAEMNAADICPYFPASLPPGRFEARVVIRNMTTGMAAVGRIPVVSPGPEVPAAGREEGARLRLSTPLLLQPGTNTAFVKLAGATDSREPPSLNSAFPFLSTKTVPVFGVLEAEASPLQAVIRVSTRTPLGEPELRWSARFVPAAGRTYAAGVTEIASQPSADAGVFFLDLDRPRLPAGDYRLFIKATLERSGEEAEIEIPLRVR